MRKAIVLVAVIGSLKKCQVWVPVALLCACRATNFSSFPWRMVLRVSCAC